MTEDVLDKAQSALVAIHNLTGLQNNLASTAMTLGSTKEQVPGIDALIQEAFRYQVIQPNDLMPTIAFLQDSVKAKLSELQATFDSL